MRHAIDQLGILLVFSVCALFFTGCEKNAEDLYKRAMDLYQAGKYQKAVEVFDALLMEYPDHRLTRNTRYQLGNIYCYNLSQPQKALKYLQELYAQTPQNGYSEKALKLIGEIYDKSLNRCVDGVEAYRLLIREYSSKIEAAEYQSTIAECYFKIGEYKQAITEYNAVVEHYPDSFYRDRARFQIANSYALTEDYARAIELYQELLLSPTLSAQLVVNTKLELAYCYKQTEQFVEALAVYEELLEVDAKTVAIDKELIDRKRKYILQFMSQMNRHPQEVDWKRKK